MPLRLGVGRVHAPRAPACAASSRLHFLPLFRLFLPFRIRGTGSYTGNRRFSALSASFLRRSRLPFRRGRGVVERSKKGRQRGARELLDAPANLLFKQGDAKGESERLLEAGTALCSGREAVNHCEMLEGAGKVRAGKGGTSSDGGG